MAQVAWTQGRAVADGHGGKHRLPLDCLRGLVRERKEVDEKKCTENSQPSAYAQDPEEHLWPQVDQTTTAISSTRRCRLSCANALACP